MGNNVANIDLDTDAPRTPRDSVVPPDPSSLSIAHMGRSSPVSNGSLSAPATPTTGDRGQNRHLVTPVNAHGRTRIEVDECLLNRFSRVDPIGQGEFSSVFRVAYPKNSSDMSSPSAPNSASFVPPGSPAPGTAFAVKKSRHRYTGARDRELKLEEAQILHRLANADHVVKYFDSWEMDDHLYIKMEYCDEGSLDKFLSSIGTKGRLDDFRIWKIIHDLSLVS
jgi:mitosis inhibitor protein kinase SWE1